MPVPNVRLAITGTDTGVGKTYVSCALIDALRTRGLHTAAMKPIETGVDAVDVSSSSDAARLWRACGDERLSIDDVCPIALRDPLAPWIAAQRAGTVVDLSRLDDAFARLSHDRDAIVVEGAGGLLVPFDRTLTLADLATRWSLDLVIVAANRLGVINHTLLTLREAERRGLRVRAIVLNDVSDARGVAEETNADALRALVGATPVIELRHARDDASIELHALADLCCAS